MDDWRFGDWDDWSSVLKSKLKATEQPLQYPLDDCFTPSRCWHFAEILHTKKSLIFLLVVCLGGIIHLIYPTLKVDGHCRSTNDWALVPTFTHLGSCSSGCTSWHNDTQKFLKSESEVPRGQKLMHTFAGGCMLECLGYMLKKFPSSFSVAKKLIQETCGVTVSTYFCSPSNL